MLIGIGAGIALAVSVWGSEHVAPKLYHVSHPVCGDHYVGFWSADRYKDPEQFAGMSDQQLRALIDERGRAAGDNGKMHRVAYNLAWKYHQTKDVRYAHKAAVILQRYAEVIGKWPYFDQSGKKSFPHDVLIKQYGVMMPPHYAGFWSDWHPYDLRASSTLALAYDLIYDSGQMEALGPGARQQIERDLLLRNLAIADRYPIGYGNTVGDLIVGMIAWGMALGAPEVVHRGIRVMDDLMRVSYFPSSYWHEGSPGYHMMITSRLAHWLPTVAFEYSDPPGYIDPVDATRFDDLDVAERYQPFFAKAARTLLKLVLPDGRFLALHDSGWEQTTSEWWGHYGMIRDYRPENSSPTLLPWVGHAILGQGVGEDQVQVHLHYGGTWGHDHLDNLNIVLWAKGRELLSETTYRGNRAWQSSTAGHNAVVVDERSQLGRSSAPQRPLSDKDLVEGVEDFRFARFNLNHGTCLREGKLRLWVPDDERLQVVEVDSERAYGEHVTSLYRRTIAVVKTSDTDVYVLDIFRVRGGSVHDWMLHGCLPAAYSARTSLELKPRAGKLHKWLENVRSAVTDESWSVDFRSPEGQATHTVMLPARDTEVILADGPAMRRDGNAPFLDVRRTGAESVFVAVHEPYVGVPRIQSVRAVASKQQSDLAVAIRVELPDREDLLLSTLSADGFVEAGDIGLRGRFGYVSLRQGSPEHMLLVEGSELRAADRRLRGTPSVVGSVQAIERVASGAGRNAFITDSAVPTDYVGKVLLTEDGEGSVKAFPISRLERTGGKTIIETRDEPGMEIREDMVKLQYFPNWGIPGPLRFKIVNTVALPA